MLKKVTSALGVFLMAGSVAFAGQTAAPKAQNEKKAASVETQKTDANTGAKKPTVAKAKKHKKHQKKQASSASATPAPAAPAARASAAPAKK